VTDEPHKALMSGGGVCEARAGRRLLADALSDAQRGDLPGHKSQVSESEGVDRGQDYGLRVGARRVLSMAAAWQP